MAPEKHPGLLIVARCSLGSVAFPVWHRGELGCDGPRLHAGTSGTRHNRAGNRGAAEAPGSARVVGRCGCNPRRTGGRHRRSARLLSHAWGRAVGGTGCCHGARATIGCNGSAPLCGAADTVAPQPLVWLLTVGRRRASARDLSSCDFLAVQKDMLGWVWR